MDKTTMERITLLYKRDYTEIYFRMPNFVKKVTPLIVCKNGFQVVKEIKKAFPKQPEIVDGVLNAILYNFEHIKSSPNTSANAEIFLDGFASGIIKSMKGTFEPELYEKDELMLSFTESDGCDDINENHFGPCALIINFNNFIYVCRTPDIMDISIYDISTDMKLDNELLEEICEWLETFHTEDEEFYIKVASLWRNEYVDEYGQIT